MVILDIELYKNYLLIYFKDIKTGKYKYYEMFPGQPLDIGGVKGVMERNTTIGFNSLSYDLPLIVAALEGWDNEHLKAFSDKIIKSNKPSWSICKTNSIFIPENFDHIDLIEVAPGMASLKLYGCRMKAPKIQDLPIEPGDSIGPEMREELREYCKNDLSLTEMLYNALKPQIDLRVSMSAQYGIDLRSKSDAQIAEAVIKSELEKKAGRKYKPLKIKDGTTIKYQDPKIVSFQSRELNDIFERILDHNFELAGKIQLPKWMKALKIPIGTSIYQMGIGGVHSTESGQLVRADDGILCEMDCVSFYPNIVIQQKLAPKAMGTDFMEVYKNIVETRIHAKKKMQEIEKEIKELEKELETL